MGENYITLVPLVSNILYNLSIEILESNNNKTFYGCSLLLFKLTVKTFDFKILGLFQGVLPVASYHCKDKPALEKRFDTLKKCNDVSGGLLELQDYMHTLAIKLKIAE